MFKSQSVVLIGQFPAADFSSLWMYREKIATEEELDPLHSTFDKSVVRICPPPGDKFELLIQPTNEPGKGVLQLVLKNGNVATLDRILGGIIDTPKGQAMQFSEIGFNFLVEQLENPPLALGGRLAERFADATITAAGDSAVGRLTLTSTQAGQHNFNFSKPIERPDDVKTFLEQWSAAQAEVEALLRGAPAEARAGATAEHQKSRKQNRQPRA